MLSSMGLGSTDNYRTLGGRTFVNHLNCSVEFLIHISLPTKKINEYLKPYLDLVAKHMFNPTGFGLSFIRVHF
jgi:hypothetical protein